ncbi:helix-turn-helix domain-containing protein [Cohnella soli]|uniref:Helix-turn-helix domain-containing protein n=1 Tax=Cohnella soli TaxID=425005 RepID=A0ABW0HPD3_9BACL
MTAYIKASEAAAELGITTTSLYRIRNHADPSKKLEPVNKKTYKVDGGFVYRREDIDHIKPVYVKRDLTVSEAAKKIGRSPTHIHKLLREAKLPFYEGELRGKRTFFIEEEDLRSFISSNPDSGKHETIFDRKTGAYLYQAYRFGKDNARIVSMNRVNYRKTEIVLQTGNGEISYEQAALDGWVPLNDLQHKKAITSQGYARFEFPRPASIESIIYSIIEELFLQVGPANIRIRQADKIVVEVKKSVLVGVMPTTHPDMIDKLQLFITQGEIVPKYDGTLIDTCLSPITIYVPDSKKLEISRRAAEANMTLQEWIYYRMIADPEES